MKNGIQWIGCMRPGCNRELGARRYVDGEIVEEEFHPYAVKDGDNYYCIDCIGKKDEWKDLLEDSEC